VLLAHLSDPHLTRYRKPPSRRWTTDQVDVYGHRMPDRRFERVELRTARLLLRAASPADQDGQVIAYCDQETQRWLPLPRPYTAAAADAFAAHSVRVRTEGHGAAWAIEYQGRYAGSIDLKRPDWVARSVEVGYLTAPWARGRGIMTEALSALTDWVLGQGFTRVEVRAAVGNVGSRRVTEKAGFRRKASCAAPATPMTDPPTWSCCPASLTTRRRRTRPSPTGRRTGRRGSARPRWWSCGGQRRS